MSKEHNFISAVVYVRDDTPQTEQFFSKLFACLEEHFMQYEVIAVNGDSANNKMEKLRGLKSRIAKPMTIINMSLRQSREQCMNAGLDMSIGDYVYEFDSTEARYDFDLVWEAYQTAVQGSDIVTACPKDENKMSRSFYRIFNAHSRAAYPLRTNAFRLVSRRALNRVHAINANLPYRKAAYAASGLKMAELEFDGQILSQEEDRFTLAADSLVLYTDFGYKFSLRFAVMMALITMVELIYTVTVWLMRNPVSGWTTTMFVLTLGLTGLFIIFAMTLKYLTLLIRIVFNRQNYLIESVEKL